MFKNEFFAQVIREYVFGEYSLDSIYKFIGENVPNDRKEAVALSLLQQALRAAYKSLINEGKEHIPINNLAAVQSNSIKKEEEKDMVHQIVNFVEKNVDGNGNDATITAVLELPMVLTKGYEERLKDTIRKIKEESDAEDWDTDTIVNVALAHVFGTEASVTFVNPDLEIVF